MPLTCRNVRQLHDGYIDGELSPSMNAEVHAHLLQCPECQRQIEMVRTCGDVIAQDRSEPVLDAGFASRVLAAMPPVGERAASSPLVGAGRIIETRRGRRRRMARAWIRSAVPVAAAVAFFCLAVWPPMRTAGRPHIVAPSVTEFVPPNVLEPVESLRDTIGCTQQILREGARDRLSEGLSAVKDGDSKAEERSLLEFLFPSVGDLIETPKPKASSGSSGDEIIRF